MKRCKRCLMPDTRPDTDFVKGVCTACLTHDAQMKIDWTARRQDLTDLLDRHGWKCIVASSGGKDSYSQVHDLLDMGADVTIVTATTCMLTPMGRKNIDNLKRYANTIEVSPNADVRARLNYLGLTMVGDISWPEHVAIFTTPIRMAIALGIPLVFYGENPQAAYGGPVGADEARQMTQRWVSEFGGFLGMRPSDVIGMRVRGYKITKADMEPYMFPADTGNVEAHFLGQYLGPWDSRRNADIAEDMGMEWERPTPANWWGFENQDNAMTGLHDYMMYKKYGYGRACAQISVDIRYDRLTRAEGEALLAKYQGFFPHSYAGISLTQILDRIGITEAELNKIIDKFTPEKYSR